MQKIQIKFSEDNIACIEANEIGIFHILTSLKANKHQVMIKMGDEPWEKL